MILKPEKPCAAKLPVAFLVHGGPQGSFGDSWSTRWNPRLYAEQGYGVVTVDFHGSTGYGQAFTDSINKDWGGKPLEELVRKSVGEGQGVSVRVDLGGRRNMNKQKTDHEQNGIEKGKKKTD